MRVQNLKIHEGNKDYKCESGVKPFSDTGFLKKHVHIIHRGKIHKCNVCSKTFSVKRNLNMHLKRIHSVAQ